MEYLDIVDKQGNPTGDIIDRYTAHLQGIPHRTAHVWILHISDDKFKVLLQKRSKNKDLFPDCFDISSAGHIPSGIDYTPSALRELKEELGIEADANQLIFCGQLHTNTTFYNNNIQYKDNQISNIYLIVYQSTIPHIIIQKEELESVSWFYWDECYRNVKYNLFKHCIAIQELDMVQEKIISLYHVK